MLPYLCIYEKPLFCVEAVLDISSHLQTSTKHTYAPNKLMGYFNFCSRLHYLIRQCRMKTFMVSRMPSAATINDTAITLYCA